MKKSIRCFIRPTKRIQTLFTLNCLIGFFLVGNVTMLNAQVDALSIDNRGKVTIDNNLDINGTLKANTMKITKNFTAEYGTKSFSVPIWEGGNGIIVAGVFDGKGLGPQLRFRGLQNKGFIDIGNNKNGDFVIENQYDGAVMTVTQDRKVGIGTTTPKNLIDLGIGQGKKLAIYQNHDKYDFYGFGISSSTLEIHAGSTQNSDPKMVVKYNGSVGIGTTNPTKGKLEVYGTGTFGSTLGQYTLSFYKGGGVKWGSPLTKGTTCSIYASNDIVGYRIVAFSDSRIKNIEGQSEAKQDLLTLKKIKIQDYTLKDWVTHGNQPTKKVIAQQLMEVYPQAVSLSTDEVPDIYQFAQASKGWFSLTTDLKVGEKVKILFEKGEKVLEVLETKTGAFRVDSDYEGEAFVYGRQVDDFHSVDYDAVSMLHVSATQELARQVKQQADRIAELEQQLQEMESLKASVAQLQAMMQQETAEVSSTKIMEQ